MADTIEQQLALTSEQAACLQQATRLPQFEKFGQTERLSGFLRSIVDESVEVTDVPEDLHAVTRNTARLVIKAELTHTAGLVNSGQMAQLETRMDSEFGLTSKLSLLKNVLENDPIQSFRERT